ncbi:MAG: tetratricopeptide repeat protein [Muribaculaceae bacterium]|nr:tetratricopeptide repeat protein [Muribaculaceae bacterium]
MKHLLFILSLLFSFTIFAQEQKIVVKTRGKIGTEGNIIPGQYIKGAYVKIKNDHKYVTNKQGEFSFVPNKGSYIISKVSYSDRNSNKYMISNFDEWGKELNYSENTKYIVISTPKEQIRDILEARYYFTCVLDNILQADINEVDSLASERQLSGVNTDIKHFLINNYRDVAKKLIEELSLHFASIDYDQLNNFDKEFFYYLCTYQFQKADSMFCSIDIPNENRYTLNPLPRKAMLRLADYYDKAYILHASQFSLEMAAHYLGLKADLDVTNTSWQVDAATFYKNYSSNTDRSNRYYERIFKNQKSKETVSNNDVILLLGNIGKEAMNGKEYQVAFLAYKEYISKQEELHGVNHVKYAEANEKLGDLLFETEIYDKALEYYLNAMSIYTKELSCEHYKTMAVYPKLADTYKGLGENEKAKSVEIDHLLLMEKVLGGDYSFSVNIYYALAEVYFEKKEYTTAYDYYRKTIDVYERLGGNPYCIINSYNKLGNIYLWNNDNAQAMELYNCALALIEDKVGKDCIAKAEALINKAKIYYSIGDYENTLKYSHSALDIAITELGKENPAVAEYYVKVGDLYLKLREDRKALDYFKKALILKEEEGSDKELLESLYDYMACTHFCLKEYLQALYYYEKFLETAEQRVPKDDGMFVDLYVRMSLTCANMGELEDALDYCYKSLNILKNKKLEVHPDIFEHCGDVLYNLNRQTEALDYWNKALNAGGNKERLNGKIKNGL